MCILAARDPWASILVVLGTCQAGFWSVLGSWFDMIFPVQSAFDFDVFFPLPGLA